MTSTILFIFLLTLSAGALAGAIVLSVCKKAKILAKILYSVAITITWCMFYLVAALFVGLFLGLSGVFWEIVMYVVGGLIWLVGVLILWGAFKKKAVWISLVVVTLLFVTAMGGHLGYRSYLDSIPTMDENADLLPTYAPWQDGTKAVSLSQPSTLQLTEPLPRMDGATALFPVYASFAKAVYPKDLLLDWEPYLVEGPLVCNKTNGAYDALIYGDADIIFVSGPSQEQQAQAAAEGVELIYTPIGKEGFVFFVNSANPMENISVEQIKDIYSGKITAWKDLEVEGFGKIRAFQRPENSGSQTRLQKLMGDTPLMDPPQMDVVLGMGGIIRKTADYKNHKNAIGYSFRFYATEMAANDQIKLLNIEGVAPTEENIANGSYPLTGTFYAVTRKDAGENVQKLLDWIQGPQGQQIIADVGYTPLNP